VLDPATGDLRYSAAGHPPAVVVAPDGRTTWLDDASSVPFCGIPVEDRPEGCVTIEAGATVVLYSDGLIERRHETIDDGLERLEEVVVRLRTLPVEELCAALLEEVIGAGSTDDDAVVLCLRSAPRTGLQLVASRGRPHHAAEPLSGQPGQVPQKVW
jgi:serine phosphatase RsbU (regulator of sigma subunit)